MNWRRWHSAINVQTWPAPRHQSPHKGCSWKMCKEFPCAVSWCVGGPGALPGSEETLSALLCTDIKRSHSAHYRAWSWLTVSAYRGLSAAPTCFAWEGQFPAQDPSHGYSQASNIGIQKWGDPKEKFSLFWGTTTSCILLIFQIQLRSSNVVRSILVSNQKDISWNNLLDMFARKYSSLLLCFWLANPCIGNRFHGCPWLQSPGLLWQVLSSDGWGQEAWNYFLAFSAHVKLLFSSQNTDCCLLGVDLQHVLVPSLT